MHCVRLSPSTCAPPSAPTASGTYSIGETLYRLTDQSVEVLGCDGAGVSVGDADGHLRFVTATDAFVVPAEEQQVRLEDGSCHEVFTTALALPPGIAS